MASGARRWRARARVGWLAACTVTMSARLRAIIVSLYVCSTESFLSTPNRMTGAPGLLTPGPKTPERPKYKSPGQVARLRCPATQKPDIFLSVRPVLQSLHLM